MLTAKSAKAITDTCMQAYIQEHYQPHVNHVLEVCDAAVRKAASERTTTSCINVEMDENLTCSDMLKIDVMVKNQITRLGYKCTVESFYKPNAIHVELKW